MVWDAGPLADARAWGALGEAGDATELSLAAIGVLFGEACLSGERQQRDEGHHYRQTEADQHS